MTAITGLSKEGFVQLWKSLYDPATVLASVKEPKPSLEAHRAKIVGILNGMTKIIFGLDEVKKAIAICYGEGSLELCMKLVTSAQIYDKDLIDDSTTAVWRSSLKFVKCSIIRNTVGRARCRTAGILEFCRQLFLRYLDLPPDSSTTALMVEDAMTTLAAICLRDDLNALQASIQLRHCVDRASIKYPSTTYESMHQKITYLSRLFDMMEIQEATLLHDFVSTDFFPRVARAELELRLGIACAQAKQYANAEQHYTRALGCVASALRDKTTTSSSSSSSSSTKLLNPLQMHLYEQRALVRISLKIYEAAVRDAERILELAVEDDTTMRGRAQLLRARAMQGASSQSNTEP